MRFLRAKVVGAALIVWLVAAAGLGCGKSMALDPRMTAVDVSKKSVAVFVLRCANTLRGTAYQPEAKWLQIGEVGKGGGDRYILPAYSNPYEDAFRDVLVSVALEPGTYRVGTVHGETATVPGLADPGVFEFPLGAEFNVPPSSVVYVGRAVMTNTERKGGEPASGSIFPIIPQSMTGFASGTMKIEISDAGDQDIPKFVQTYPCLKGVTVQRSVMRKMQ